MTDEPRIEHDLLGEVAVPAGSLHGAHTERALENFPLAGAPGPRGARPGLRGRQARLRAHQPHARRLGGRRGDAKADAIERACRELADGLLDEHIVVDRLQGGAGTSTNMNVNEVLANRALQLLGEAPGDYARVSPSDDLNLHQSTNDTYPTALRLAAIDLLHRLEEQIVALQEAFQAKEQEFAHVVKVGRTEGQDAVLTTLGREMGAYAEALNRDRWRIYKCEERLRVVNLGGTAIGTGLRRAARVHLPRRRHAARAHQHRVRPRREPHGGHAERGRLRRGLRHPEGARRDPAQDLRRPAPPELRPGGRARRDPAAAAAGRLQHHARQGQSGDPRGREPGGPARVRLRRDHRHRRRPRQPRAQRVPAARGRLPAREPAAARRRRRSAAPVLRRGHRGRRGALRRAGARLQRGGHGARPGDRLRRRLRRRPPRARARRQPSATSSSPTASSPPSSTTNC